MSGIEQAVKVFAELRGEFEKLSPQYFAVTGLSRGEAFALIYSEACKFERMMNIEQRKQNHSEEKATEKQIKYINNLRADNSAATKIIFQYLQEKGKEKIEELSKEEASALIDKILKGDGQ